MRRRAQFQAARIPKFDNPLGVAEGDILSTVGWLHLVAAEADGDYHIQISPTHNDDQYGLPHHRGADTRDGIRCRCLLACTA